MLNIKALNKAFHLIIQWIILWILDVLELIAKFALSFRAQLEIKEQLKENIFS